MFSAESSKLCLKDLSDDVFDELSKRLGADEATLNKFSQLFELKMGFLFTEHWYLGEVFSLKTMKQFHPYTKVSELKECFDALWLYDLSEILEKVRPRPAVSQEQIEKIRRAGDRPTNYYSNVAVLVVNLTVEEDIFERNEAEKIESFIKDLNSRNEVAIISLASLQETREFVREPRKRNGKNYHSDELRLKENLESVLQRKACLDKELEMGTNKERKQRENEEEMRQLEQLELRFRGELEVTQQEKKQTARDLETLKELEKEFEKSVSTAIGELIHNQGWVTLPTYIHTRLFK